MQAATKVTERAAKGSSGDPVTVMTFTGDISSTSKDAILEAYRGLAADVRKVLLDFRGVEYINSSGIAIIIQLLLEAHKTESRTIGVCGLTAHFVKVFTMVGVAKYAVISPDEAAALSKL
jgi:anti-sigma B factor antagonist